MGIFSNSIFPAVFRTKVVQYYAGKRLDGERFGLNIITTRFWFGGKSDVRFSGAERGR
jgi:hypothetical protein